MSNPYYNHGAWPAAGSAGQSAPARSELDAITAGFALLPALTANTAVVVNAGGTALTNTVGTFALAGNFATTGAFSTTLVAGASISLTLPVVAGTLATLAGTETLSNKTLTAPALGTPASGVLTNCTGTASGLTAGTVTTNANLTGHVTSVGNAAVLGSFTSAQLAAALTDETGSGAAVFATSPSFTTPVLGTPTSGNLANCTFPTLNQNTTGNALTATTAATVTGAAQTAITQVGSDLGIDTPALTTGGYSTLTMGNTTGVFQRLFANSVESLRLTVTTVDQTLAAYVGNLVLNGTSGVNVTSPLKVGGNLIVSTTAPTIASGFGTSPSIVANNTAAFRVTVGSGGVSGTGVITMPAAPNGWICNVQNISRISGAPVITAQTGSSTTSVNVTQVNTSTGNFVYWVANDVLLFQCTAF